jgi:hypothetical protein
MKSAIPTLPLRSLRASYGSWTNWHSPSKRSSGDSALQEAARYPIPKVGEQIRTLVDSLLPKD